MLTPVEKVSLNVRATIKYERWTPGHHKQLRRNRYGRRFYFGALADAGVDHFKDTLNEYPQFFKADASAGAEK